eukprot:11224437-Lingulodinium_polyedra.AAC.1
MSPSRLAIKVSNPRPLSWRTPVMRNWFTSASHLVRLAEFVAKASLGTDRFSPSCQPTPWATSYASITCV